MKLGELLHQFQDEKASIPVVIAADEGKFFDAEATISYARRPGIDPKRFPGGVDEVIPYEECEKRDHGAFPVFEIKISGS